MGTAEILNEIQTARVQRVISTIEMHTELACIDWSCIMVSGDTRACLVELDFGTHKGLIWVRKSGLVRTDNGKTVVLAKGGHSKSARVRIDDIIKPKMFGCA